MHNTNNTNKTGVKTVKEEKRNARTSGVYVYFGPIFASRAISPVQQYTYLHTVLQHN